MSDAATITAGVRQLAAAFSAGDVVSLVSLFSDDAITMPPNDSACVGKDAIRSWHEIAFAEFEADAELVAEEVEVSGDWASVRGTFSMTATPPAGDLVQDTGKFIMIWKRGLDGTWKISRNIWNSDNPPA